MDSSTIDKMYQPFKLIEKQRNTQLAIIFCENMNEAIKVYADRKNISVDDLLNKFIVTI